MVGQESKRKGVGERERERSLCTTLSCTLSDAATELRVRAHKRATDEAAEREGECDGRACTSEPKCFVLAAIARPTVLSYSYPHDVIKATASPCTSALRWP